MSPVAWLYMQNPPQDGQVFLTWQSPNVKGFASDGYIWADPEAQFHHTISGYVSGAHITIHNKTLTRNRL
jgi:hypothetical protein